MGYTKISTKSLETADTSGTKFAIVEAAVKRANDNRLEVLKEIKDLDQRNKAALSMARKIGDQPALDKAAEKARAAKEAAHKAYVAAQKTAAAAMSKSEAAAKTYRRAEAQLSGLGPDVAKAKTDLLLANKALDGVKSDIKTSKGKIAKAEKVLKAKPQDAKANKEKLKAEAELKAAEKATDSAEKTVTRYEKSYKTVLAIQTKAEASLTTDRKARDKANAISDSAVQERDAAKIALDTAVAAFAEADKAAAKDRKAYYDVNEEIETCHAALIKHKGTLKAANDQLADAQTALDQRTSKENELSTFLGKIGALLVVLDNDIKGLESVSPQAPEVTKRLQALRSGHKKCASTHQGHKGDVNKKALAAQQAKLVSLADNVNDLADGLDGLNDEMERLRDAFFEKEMLKFREATAKRLSNSFVKAAEIKFFNKLAEMQKEAKAKGWTQKAITKAQTELEQAMARKADREKSKGEEQQKIDTLKTDQTYANLRGLAITIAELRRQDKATYESVKDGLDKALTSQRKPSTAAWLKHLNKNGIQVNVYSCPSTEEGVKLHVTLKAGFLSDKAKTINLGSDTTKQAMDKLFKLSRAIFELHATVEGGKWGNSIHYYYGGTLVGSKDAGVRKYLKDTLETWLKANVEPIITAAKLNDGKELIL